MSRFIPPALAMTLALLLAACGGGGGGGGTGASAPPPAPTRSFYMGASPFFATATAFPDFRLENMDERDLLSVHIDDFWGVPWDQCAGTACTALPAAFVARWQQLAASAQASGKVLYLAVSPLANRRTLSGSVQADGSVLQGWLPPGVIDGNGCYLFSADAAHAAGYAAAYVNFVRYLVDLVHPSYLSPAIEMNMPFTTCASQKSAWIAWYTSVYNALKAAYPTLPIFPTFQLEFLYGSAEPAAACAMGTSYTDCFKARLNEALAIAGDRIAFSSYPEGWTYSGEFNFGVPPDTFAITRAATTRRIWVSETGWNTVPVRSSYAHATGGSCSATFLLPDTVSTPAGTKDLANNAAQAAYMSWLLGQAQGQQLEAVIWWLNRDYLDGAVSATCPCAPSTSDTCRLADTFYAAGGDFDEGLLRGFGNMALRNFDGSARPAEAVWKQYFGYARQP
jgi:hypothetical protein